jgi:hypothetical protein
MDRQMMEAFLGQKFGFRPADDDASPIGPWGPILRSIVGVRFTPTPVPWKFSAFGPLPDPWLYPALNPQPLPPSPDPVSGPVPDPWLWSWLVESLLARLALVDEIGRATSNDSLGSDYIQSMIDDLCPPPRVFKLPKPKGGDGDPPPRPDELVISASDLIMIGAGLRQAAGWMASERIRDAVNEAGIRGMEVGLENLGS